MKSSDDFTLSKFPRTRSNLGVKITSLYKYNTSRKTFVNPDPDPHLLQSKLCRTYCLDYVRLHICLPSFRRLYWRACHLLEDQNWEAYHLLYSPKFDLSHIFLFLKPHNADISYIDLKIYVCFVCSSGNIYLYLICVEYLFAFPGLCKCW